MSKNVLNQLMSRRGIAAIGTAGALAVGVGIAGGFGAPKSAAQLAAASAAAAVQASETTAWKVDKVHSGVNFKIRHAGVANFYGRFNEIDGRFTFDPSNLSNASFAFSIPVSSLDTNNSRRDQDLQANAFFNMRQFPTISFESTGVTQGASGMYTLSGDLTIQNETLPIDAQLEWIGTGELFNNPKSGFEATFTIDRTKWGLTKWAGVLGNDIELTVWVEGDPA